jgi:hypothetical protein
MNPSWIAVQASRGWDVARDRRVGEASWLNLVGIFFGIITRHAIRRGSFDSVRDLIEAIERFIEGWNERCHPFVWTKDADTIRARPCRARSGCAR